MAAKRFRQLTFCSLVHVLNIQIRYLYQRDESLSCKKSSDFEIPKGRKSALTLDPILGIFLNLVEQQNYGRIPLYKPGIWEFSGRKHICGYQYVKSPISFPEKFCSRLRAAGKKQPATMHEPNQDFF